jgi:hypothetical protein
MAVIHRPAAFCTGRLWWTRHPTLYARSMIAFWNWASVTACPVLWHDLRVHSERLFADRTDAMVIAADRWAVSDAWAKLESLYVRVGVFAADHVHD